MTKTFRVILIALLMVVGLGETASAFAQPPHRRYYHRRFHHRPYYRHHHYYRHR